MIRGDQMARDVLSPSARLVFVEHPLFPFFCTLHNDNTEFGVQCSTTFWDTRIRSLFDLTDLKGPRKKTTKGDNAIALIDFSYLVECRASVFIYGTDCILSLRFISNPLLHSAGL